MKAIHRVLQLIEDKGLKPAAVEKKLDLSNGYLSTMAKRGGSLGEETLLKLSIFLDKSLNYLMTGEEIEKIAPKKVNGTHKDGHQVAQEPSPEYQTKGVPLVKVEAFGGAGSETFTIHEEDIQQYYVVPDFQNIDFMIRVKGTSMGPKYNSGDIVGCRVLHNPQYIQWNKVHVIATKDQGIIIKRIKKGSTDKKWLIVSDNKEYESFEIPRTEVTGVALVVGVIRLE